MTAIQILDKVLTDRATLRKKSAEAERVYKKSNGELAGLRTERDRLVDEIMTDANFLTMYWSDSGYHTDMLTDDAKRDELLAFIDRCLNGEEETDPIMLMCGVGVEPICEEEALSALTAFYPKYVIYCAVDARITELEAVESVEAASDKVEAVTAPYFTDAGLSAIFTEMKHVYIDGRETDWLALCHGKAINGSTLKWMYRNGNKGQQALAELLLMMGYKLDDLFGVMEKYFGVQYINTYSLTSKLNAGEHSAAYGKLLDIVNKHRAIR